MSCQKSIKLTSLQVQGFPSQELAQGHFTKVPLLVDTEGYEGFLFSNQSQRNMTEETTDLEVLFPYAKDSFFTRLYQLYPANAYNSTLFQRQTIYGNYIIGMSLNTEQPGGRAETGRLT